MANFGAPFLSLSPHALVFALCQNAVHRPEFAPIHHILLMCAKPQVGSPIVTGVPIPMIDLRSIWGTKDEPVQLDVSTINPRINLPRSDVANRPIFVEQIKPLGVGKRDITRTNTLPDMLSAVALLGKMAA